MKSRGFALDGLFEQIRELVSRGELTYGKIALQLEVPIAWVEEVAVELANEQE
jgi:hypothetical protein